jgi:hypothetical protein
VHHYVPYNFVLRAALANSLGNKSLFNSGYEAYKTVRKREAEGSADILKRYVKKTKNAKENPMDLLYRTASLFCNPAKQILYIKMVYLVWKRYLHIYETCDKDSVDIDSDDFVISEIEELTDQVKQKQQTNLNRGSSTNSKQGSILKIGSRKGSMLNLPVKGGKPGSSRNISITNSRRTSIDKSVNLHNIHAGNLNTPVMDSIDNRELRRVEEHAKHNLKPDKSVIQEEEGESEPESP